MNAAIVAFKKGEREPFASRRPIRPKPQIKENRKTVATFYCLPNHCFFGRSLSASQRKELERRQQIIGACTELLRNYQNGAYDRARVKVPATHECFPAL